MSLCFSGASVAQSPYYVLTNDSNNVNSGTLFNLDLPSGTLTPVHTFLTGGLAVEGGYYAGVTQAYTRKGECIFIADGLTNDIGDIAAFSKATQYSKVGNYSNPSLSGASNMPMIVNSDGTLLYASYELSSSLAVWTINPDCSLTIANIYTTTSLLGSMAITHDGKLLVVTYELAKEAGTWTISGSNLTDNGAVPAIEEVSGVALTKDDAIVVMGTGYTKSTTSAVVTASLPGLTNQRAWRLGPGYNAASLALSPTAEGGNGCLNVGNTGNGSSGTAGVTGATFTENPMNITYVNNVTSSLPTFVGNIATISKTGRGSGVYAAETAGYIGVYSASPTCAVTLVKENADPNSSFILSLSSIVK
jgi:hypothetical protein